MGPNVLKLFAALLFLCKASEGAFGPTTVAKLSDFPYIVQLVFRPENWFQTALAVLNDKWAFGGSIIIYPSDTPDEYDLFSYDTTTSVKTKHRVRHLDWISVPGFLFVKVCKPFVANPFEGIGRMGTSGFNDFSADVTAKALFYENSVLKYKTVDALSLTNCAAKTFLNSATFDSTKNLCSAADPTPGALNFTSPANGTYLNDFLLIIDQVVEGVPLKNISHTADNGLGFPIMYASVKASINDILVAVA